MPLPKLDATWMAEMGSQIGHLQLREIAFPGSHVSASSMLATMGDFSPDVRVWASGLFRTGTFERVVAAALPWARTQRAGIRAQLEAGIRYFDLRVWHDGGETVVCHALRGGPVSRVVEDVASFVFERGHEREVLILDFHAFYDMTAAAHERLVWQLYNALGPALVPRTRNLDTTLDALWEAGQRVIVLYGEEAAVGETDVLWSRKRIREARPAARDTAGLKPQLARALDSWRDEQRFRVLQVALTPDEKLVAAGLAGAGPMSLAEATYEAAPELERWLRDEWANHPVNVVTADFVAGEGEHEPLLPRFASIVRALNQPFHATTRIVPCRAGDVHYVLCYEPASGDVAVSRLDLEGYARITCPVKPRAWAPRREIVPFSIDGEALFFQYDPASGAAAIAALDAGGAGTRETWSSDGDPLLPGFLTVAYTIGADAFLLQYAPSGEHAGTAQIRRLSRDGAKLVWTSHTWWHDMQIMTWCHAGETWLLQYGYEGEHAGATNLYRLRHDGVDWTWGVPSRTWRDRLTVVPCVPRSPAEHMLLLQYSPDTGRVGLHALLRDGSGTRPLWPEGPEGHGPPGPPTHWAPGLTIVHYHLNASQYLLLYQAQTGAVEIERLAHGGLETERTFEDAGAWRTGLDLTPVAMREDKVLVIHRRRETGEAGVEDMNPGGLGATPVWR